MKKTMMIGVLLLNLPNLFAYSDGNGEWIQNTIVMHRDTPDAIVIENLSGKDLRVAMRWKKQCSRRFGRVDPWRDGEHLEECELSVHEKLFIARKTRLQLELVSELDGVMRQIGKVTTDQLVANNCVQVLSDGIQIFRRGVKPLSSLATLCLHALSDEDRRKVEDWKESLPSSWNSE